jgi:hypothetical protein
VSLNRAVRDLSKVERAWWTRTFNEQRAWWAGCYSGPNVKKRLLVPDREHSERIPA